MIKNLFMCIFIFCIVCKADARFDTLFAHSEVIIYGQIIQHEISPFQWDLGTKTCYIDFRIDEIGPGGKLNKSNLKLPQPGDTLHDVEYFGGDNDDTLNIYVAYVIPMTHDSMSWKMTHAETDGVFSDHSLMLLRCSFIYVQDVEDRSQILMQITRTKGAWAIRETYYGNDELKEVLKVRWGKPVRRIEKRITFNERGRKMNRTRVKGKPGLRGWKTITWTFRSDGKVCLRRKVQYNEKVNR